MRSISTPLLLVLFLLSACSSAPPPPPPGISVSATEPADMKALAGEWYGEYSNAGTGRNGAIRMTLVQGENTAHGDVLMFPGQPGGEERRENQIPGEGRGAQPLSISFIAIAGGQVSGTLDPYRDPDCSCMVSTTFTGRRRGDVIEGTFVTKGGPTYLAQEGRWRVDRKKG
jgi:hypothetical protein